MSRKPLRIFASILLLSSFFMGMFTYSELGIVLAPLSQSPCGESSTVPSVKKPCDMDDCKPNLPKCPLCPSSGSVVSFLNQEASDYLPPLNCSFIRISLDTLSNQGFVRSVFRPPAPLF
ncbi:MAG: hypothetical protein A2156_08725 [Deltaproteobacteria bacterium RBG_16_48_10]|nr:MAG: hypothetical protein A2156_08725 [Deltaproteobacteria bacterium RBG_16_48_10]